MTLEIHLDGSADAVYAPGAWITGHVKVPDPSAGFPVTIHFSGRSKVCITHRNHNSAGSGVLQTSTRTFNSKALIFRHSFNLQQDLEGNHQFQLQVPEWSEQLPEKILEEHGAEIFPEEPPWHPTYGAEPIQIPDTFHHYQSASANLDLEASVSYKLEAIMRKDDDKFHFRSKKDEDIEITIKNIRPYVKDIMAPRFDRRTYEDSIRTLRLLPEKADGKLSFREKTHSLFHSSRLPAASFRLAFSALDTIYLGRPSEEGLPLSLSVTRIPTIVDPEDAGKSTYTDDQIPTPQIYLKRFSLRLTSLTRGRTARPSSWSHDFHELGVTYTIYVYDERMKDLYGEEKLMIPSDGTYFNLGRELGITNAHITKEKHTASMDLVPSFNCQNIARMYMLEWQVELDICGEEIEWKARHDKGTGMPIKVLAGDGSQEDLQQKHRWQGQQVPYPQQHQHQQWQDQKMEHSLWQDQKTQQGGFQTQPTQQFYQQQWPGQSTSQQLQKSWYEEPQNSNSQASAPPPYSQH